MNEEESAVIANFFCLSLQAITIQSGYRCGPKAHLAFPENHGPSCPTSADNLR